MKFCWNYSLMWICTSRKFQLFQCFEWKKINWKDFQPSYYNQCITHCTLSNTALWSLFQIQFSQCIYTNQHQWVCASKPLRWRRGRCFLAGVQTFGSLAVKLIPSFPFYPTFCPSWLLDNHSANSTIVAIMFRISRMCAQRRGTNAEEVDLARQYLTTWVAQL